MPKVSIVVPIYNTENYLVRCLDSICNQTLLDLEIICINDYSLDNSLNIITEYSLRDMRIKVIDLKKKCGAAVARNIGIKHASGKYIGFVDSDDYIELDFYEKLFNCADRTKADIVKGANLKLIYPNGNIEIDKQNLIIANNKLFFWFQFTSCIFRINFLKDNNIFFPKNLLVGEDPVFSFKASLSCKKIEIVDDAQYYYCRRDNSMNSDEFNMEKVVSYAKYIRIMRDLILNANINKNDHKSLFDRLIHDIYCVRECKINKGKKRGAYLSDLLGEIIKDSILFPIRLLFDATVLRNAMLDIRKRRGIFWVAYNLIQRFISDHKFEVTLYLETNWEKDVLNTDNLLKDLDCVFGNYATGKTHSYKRINNTNFKPYNYDVYLNVGFESKINRSSAKPYEFYILHDIIPVLNENFNFDINTINKNSEFYNFYDKLPENSNGICISENTKTDFMKCFHHLKSKNLSIAYNSASQKFFPEKNFEKLREVLNKYHVPNNKIKKYIFAFGALDEPRKNIVFTIKCFIYFIAKYNINDLYFYLGGTGSKIIKNKLNEELGSLYTRYEEYVVFLGYIDDNDVNLFYSNSLFFVFLSLYEGFGMPVLEAMMCGVPVITSNSSSLPEVVADSAILADPTNIEDCIKSFKAYYFNNYIRNHYSDRGLARAREFTWDKTYNKISQILIKKLNKE